MEPCSCKQCGTVLKHFFRLPFSICRNLALVETICLQLYETDVETIYTLNYILKIYPPLLELKSIANHYNSVQRRLRGYAEIESVMRLHMVVLGKIPIHRDGPNTRLHEFREGDGVLCTIKCWEMEIGDATTRFPVLECLMKCGRILCTKLRQYVNVRRSDVLFVEISAKFWADDPKTTYLELREIKSGSFEVKSPGQVRNSFWYGISRLFTNILNTRHLLPYTLFSLTMSSESESRFI